MPDHKFDDVDAVAGVRRSRGVAEVGPRRIEQFVTVLVTGLRYG